MGSIPTRGDDEYLLKFIFPFFRSGVEVKRSVEFCHSTRNASRIRQKVGNGVLHKFPSAYPAVCGIQRKADLFYFLNYVLSGGAHRCDLFTKVKQR